MQQQKQQNTYQHLNSFIHHRLDSIQQLINESQEVIDQEKLLYYLQLQ